MNRIIKGICNLIVIATGWFTLLSMLTPWRNILEKIVYVVGFVLVVFLMDFVKESMLE